MMNETLNIVNGQWNYHNSTVQGAKLERRLRIGNVTKEDACEILGCTEEELREALWKGNGAKYYLFPYMAQNITRIRYMSGLTIEEISERCNKSVSAWESYEKGTAFPNGETLGVIAGLLSHTKPIEDQMSIEDETDDLEWIDGCEVCNNGIQRTKDRWAMMEFNPDAKIITIKTKNGSFNVNIKFCPFCGRNLEEGEDNVGNDA